MDKFTAMSRVYDNDLFDNSAVLMITMENGKLEVTPFGGTFLRETAAMGQEVYGMTRYLLKCASEYGGLQEDDDGRLSPITDKGKN